MFRGGRLGLLVVALDVLSIVLAFWAAVAGWAWWKPQLARVVPIQWWHLLGPNPFMPPMLLLGPAWLLALRSQWLYDPERMTSSPRIAAGVTRATLVLLVGVVVLGFFLPERTWSRLLILACAGGLALVTGSVRLLFFQLQRHLPRPLREVAIGLVGVGEDAWRMADRIQRHGHASYRVAGFLRPRAAERSRVPEDRILGETSDFARIVNAHDLRVVVLASFALEREEALALATRADQMGVKVYQVPFTWGAASPRLDLARLGDLQLVDLTALAYPSAAAQLKRIMDVLVVMVGGLLISPLLIAVAVAIKLQDGGPILYVQPRAGRGGRQFPFFKFRSMQVDADLRRSELDAQNEADGPLFKMRDDPRITPLGHFIRRWSIDELPQIWNVLRGDMNLVGPRPLPMSDLDGVEHDPEIAYWLELRGKVKPGITGAWQVSGRSDLGFQEMVQLDIAYVQDWSLWLDVVILLKTLPAVLRGRGAR